MFLCYLKFDSQLCKPCTLTIEDHFGTSCNLTPQTRNMPSTHNSLDIDMVSERCMGPCING